MGSKWAWVWGVLLIFVSLEGCLSEYGCWDEERVALLQLRHFFDSPYYLQDWVEEEHNSNCCQWERVECNNSTGRVVVLNLFSIRDRNSRERYLNTSLFSVFQKLEWLDLSYNSIAGFVDNGGLGDLSPLKGLHLHYNRITCLKGLDRLNNLEVLSLVGNMLNNSILSSLGVLSSLKILYLDEIGLKEIVDVSGLVSLNNLEFLSMGSNEIDKFILPKGSTGLRKSNITLSLQNVSTHDATSLLQSLGLFPFIKELDLSFNNFNKSTTTQELHNLTNVEELYLDYSSLHISLLQTISAFTSLRVLSMRGCYLNGTLGFQDLPNFKNLKHLYMDNTRLDSSFLQVIGQMASLESLSLSNCGLVGPLSNQGLCKITHLQELYLSKNNLTGLIPQQIGNLTRIRTLNLAHNNLTGPIPPTFGKLKQIESLDLSYNNLNGKIPPQLGELYYLGFFSVANNNLSGKIPESRQLSTFGDHGYEGNPFLCGLPLNKSCDTIESLSPMPRPPTNDGEENNLFDMKIFYISFIASYVIVLLTIVAVLCINPYWRQLWFYLIERWMTSCYYFVVDNLPSGLCADY